MAEQHSLHTVSACAGMADVSASAGMAEVPSIKSQELTQALMPQDCKADLGLLDPVFAAMHNMQLDVDDTLAGLEAVADVRAHGSPDNKSDLQQAGIQHALGNGNVQTHPTGTAQQQLLERANHVSQVCAHAALLAGHTRSSSPARPLLCPTFQVTGKQSAATATTASL